MSNEPLVTAAVIAAVIGAFITLLKAFGVPLSADQQAAISSFVVVVAPLLTAWYARSRVTPLTKPRDEDGVTLSRPGDMPAIKELANLQGEAIAINEATTAPQTKPVVGNMGLP